MAAKCSYVETFTRTIQIMGQFFEELGEFIGRAHPLLVHLPIGMLVAAFLMAILARREKYKELKVAVPVVLLFGSIAAVLASIAGYLLSLRGGYEQQTLDFHQWLGIGVALVSVFVYWMYRNKRAYRFVVFGLLIKATQTLPLGTAYAVWTGIGAVGTVLMGIIFFKEPAEFWRIFFIFTLIASIIGLKVVSSH